jgi:hypothetical protein
VTIEQTKSHSFLDIYRMSLIVCLGEDGNSNGGVALTLEKKIGRENGSENLV